MTEPIEPTPEPADDDEQVLDMAAMRRVRREAAELRKRNHELEEQLGAAAARETAHQRAVEQAARAAGMIDPSDFLAAHPDIDKFANEFHEVLPDRVAEAAKSLLEQKPHLGRPVGPPPTDRPIEGLRPGASPSESKPPATTWAGAIRGTGH